MQVWILCLFIDPEISSCIALMNMHMYVATFDNFYSKNIKSRNWK